MLGETAPNKAGWHDGPAGERQYWDGRRWHEITSRPRVTGPAGYRAVDTTDISGRRIGARIIDVTALGVLMSVLRGRLPGDVPDVVEQGVWTLVLFVYMAMSVAATGYTAGKFVTRVKVVHESGSGRPSVAAAARRALPELLVGFNVIGVLLGDPWTWLILIMWVYWLAQMPKLRPRERTMHDRFAGTMVIDVRGNNLETIPVTY